MKGSDVVLKILNEQLAEELTAVNQYMVHSSMCSNWGYQKLHNLVEKRAIQEMKHAELLIDRILFLNGSPTVSKLNPMHIGSVVEEQLKNDLESEYGAVNGYNKAIKLCDDQNDNGTRELLKSILKDEEDHVDWLEAQLDQIAQMGIQNYLVEQLG
jgi:bacterioferritin